MKLYLTKKCKKLLSLITVGLVLSTTPTGCTLDKQPIEQATPTDADKLFNEKEHIVVEKIEDPTKEIKQYQYHEGYKPIGISMATYQNLLDMTEVSSYITYENIVPIKASSQDGYKNFGYPVENQNNIKEEDKYNPYEHIVSIPYKGEIDEIEFEYHDGYEIVGICNEIKEGKVMNTYYGCILYVNIKPVEVKHHGTKDDKIEYDTFGTVIEEEKTTEK